MRSSPAETKKMSAPSRRAASRRRRHSWPRPRPRHPEATEPARSRTTSRWVTPARPVQPPRARRARRWPRSPRSCADQDGVVRRVAREEPVGGDPPRASPPPPAAGRRPRRRVEHDRPVPHADAALGHRRHALAAPGVEPEVVVAAGRDERGARCGSSPRSRSGRARTAGPPRRRRRAGARAPCAARSAPAGGSSSTSAIRLTMSSGSGPPSAVGSLRSPAPRASGRPRARSRCRRGRGGSPRRSCDRTRR